MTFVLNLPPSIKAKEDVVEGEDDEAGKRRNREEYRKVKELEEARKSGSVPAMKDESGIDINPHIPQYIMQAPWYYAARAPTLRHQKIPDASKPLYDRMGAWYKKGLKTATVASKFRKGACENCGAVSHTKKDCLERPRKHGAKWTGQDIAPDEHLVDDLNFNFEVKRDSWHGFSTDDYNEKMAEQFAKMDKAKQQVKADRLQDKLMSRIISDGLDAGIAARHKADEDDATTAQEVSETKLSEKTESTAVSDTAEKPSGDGSTKPSADTEQSATDTQPSTDAVTEEEGDVDTEEAKAEGDGDGDQEDGEEEEGDEETETRTRVRRKVKDPKLGVYKEPFNIFAAARASQRLSKANKPGLAEQMKLGRRHGRKRLKLRDGFGRWYPEDDPVSLQVLSALEGDVSDDDDDEETQQAARDEEDDDDDDLKYADDMDMPGQKFEVKERQTVRNLRIREDTAKYLYNLELNSAYYDPKTRAMRGNPLEGKDPQAVPYAGDNFVRHTGLSTEMAKQQLFAWEMMEKGVDVHLQADPTKLALLSEAYKEQKDKVEEGGNKSVLQKYGGDEHLVAPPRELLLAQTENYVEYDRQGRVVTGQEQQTIRSSYEEDVYINNHTSVWGSFWRNGHWGYKCCHSFIRESYCTGQKGIDLAEKQQTELLADAVRSNIMAAAEAEAASVAIKKEPDSSSESSSTDDEEREERRRQRKEKKRKRNERKKRKKEGQKLRKAEKRRKAQVKEESSSESDSGDDADARATADMDDKEKKAYFIAKAVAAEERRVERVNALMKLDERRRPYNSMQEIRMPTDAEMEAYRLKQRATDDPMAQFK